jgi:hypothetical protein
MEKSGLIELGRRFRTLWAVPRNRPTSKKKGLPTGRPRAPTSQGLKNVGGLASISRADSRKVTG